MGGQNRTEDHQPPHGRQNRCNRSGTNRRKAVFYYNSFILYFYTPNVELNVGIGCVMGTVCIICTDYMYGLAFFVLLHNDK